jgi:hypothetical protein
MTIEAMKQALEALEQQPRGKNSLTTPPAAQRQPLTDKQRRNIVRANKMRHDSDEIDPYGVIDDVEAAHGIGGKT